jgi:hypothetical protein
VNTLRFEPSQRIEITLADADIAISGWDQPAIELTLDGELDQCTVGQEQDTLTLTSHAALAIQAPTTVSVHVRQISGDLLLRELDGEIAVDAAHGVLSVRGGTASIAIQEIHGALVAKGLGGPLGADIVHGDIQLIDVAGGHLRQVHGNVHARSITGDLELGDVSGDVTVRGAVGAFKLDQGHGSLRAYDLQKGLEAGHIVGDLSLKTVAQPGQVYRAQTDGEIRARFPAETSARFDLQSNSSVSARLPTLEHHEQTHVIGQAGAGEAEVILQADGDLWVQVHDQHEDTFDAWQEMDSIAARIEAEIAQHLGKMNLDADTQREIDKAMRRAEQELARAQYQLEQETQRAHERAQKAKERAAKAARRAQERIARKSRSWGVTVDTGFGLFGPPPPHPHRRHKRPRVSAEEQLAILKMLQEGKISVEQAEVLLKALEE